jgi:hypothetical protein
VWPTPAIRWEGELSIELAACLLALVIAHRRFRSPPRATLRWIAALWVLLVVGHYADVTAPALYGRDINLYWDLQYMPDVAAMVARAAPRWLLVLVVTAAALTLILLYLLFRWALHRVGDAMDNSRQRLAIGLFATGVVLLFAAQRIPALSASLPRAPTFSTPVTQTYARQVRLVIDAFGGSKSLAPSPPMNGDLARVRGADVFLVFIEAYGASTYERPDIAPHLAASRADLDAAIRATNRDVVSAFVESPPSAGRRGSRT